MRHSSIASSTYSAIAVSCSKQLATGTPRGMRSGPVHSEPVQGIWNSFSRGTAGQGITGGLPPQMASASAASGAKASTASSSGCQVVTRHSWPSRRRSASACGAARRPCSSTVGISALTTRISASSPRRRARVSCRAGSARAGVAARTTWRSGAAEIDAAMRQEVALVQVHLLAVDPGAPAHRPDIGQHQRREGHEQRHHGREPERAAQPGHLPEQGEDAEREQRQRAEAEPDQVALEPAGRADRALERVDSRRRRARLGRIGVGQRGEEALERHGRARRRRRGRGAIMTEGIAAGHGSITILPVTRRSAKRRKASRQSSKATRSEITGVSRPSP